MNKKFSKLLLTSASAVALLAAYPSVAQNANEALGLDLPSITAEAATTAGNAFVKRVMDLPNVSTIASKTPEEIEDHGRDMRSIRRAYDRLSAADKDATVEKWEGYLYQKERAIGNVFVDIIMDLHTIAEIEQFDTADFAAEQRAARRARNQYEDLSQVAKENASVVKWLGYLDEKEQPLGITFVNLVGEVPNVSTLENLSEADLESAVKSVEAAETSYNSLSEAAKADALVGKWLGYLAEKKEAIEEVLNVELSVTSVSAANQRTLTVTGQGLYDLKSEDVTIENNIASSVTVSPDGKTATIALQSSLISDQDTKVTIKENDDSTKEFTVTFGFKVTTVSIDDQLFDDDRANQRVKFKINGVDADLDYLALNGYSVTFVAKDSTGASTTDLFGTATSADGIIDNPAVIGAYTVEVQVTKAGEALVTDTAEVSVVNLDAQTTALENPVFYNHGLNMSDDSSNAYGAAGTSDDDLLGDDFVQNSTTFVAGESFELLRLYGTVAGEKELITDTDIVVTSSNDAVVSVDTSNVLKAESAGTATLTFKVGAATKTVNVTVTNTKRALTKVTANPASLKLVKTYSNSVTIKSTDQYGDPFSVATADVTEDVPEDSTGTAIVDFTDLETDVPDSIGTANYVITGDEVGKGSIFFKDATTGKVLGSLLVDVTDVDNTGSVKIERIGGASTDNTLELGVDPTIVYEMARYNSQGVYIEGIDLTGKIIEVVDGTVATAQFQGTSGLTGTATTATAKAEITGAAGDISFVITGTKAGKTDILIKDVASGKQEKLTITVTANSFKVTNVDFKAAPLVDYAGATINYTNVLNVISSNDDDILTGVTLNKATQHKVRISEDGGTGGAAGVVYLDTNADGVYTSGTDIDLGFVELTSTSSSTFTGNGGAGVIADVIAGYTTASADKGTLLIKFLTDVTGADATTAIKATSVQVEVK